MFVEAPRDRSELEAIAAENLGVPLWVNLAEGGKTPMVEPSELANMGFQIAVYPGAASKTVAKVLVELMQGIKRHGSVEPFLDGMMTLGERSALLDLASYEALDQRFAQVGAPTERT